MNSKTVLAKVNRICSTFNKKRHRNRAMQRNFLQKMPLAQEDTERSYFQYKCWAFLLGVGKPFLNNVFAFPLLMRELLLYKMKAKPKCNDDKKKKKNAAFFPAGNETRIPNILREEYEEIISVKDVQGTRSGEDFVFIKKYLLRRYPFSFFFLLKIIYKIKMYRGILEQYSVGAIITTNEYSFTSSVLTLFCNENGIEHINVMHGEKSFLIRDAYFRYDRCYVWDQFYVDLFRELRATENNFIIAIPPHLILNTRVVAKEVDYTYYLADEGKNELQKIRKCLMDLKNKGMRVAYRPHPIYETKCTEKVLEGIERETSEKYDIGLSIMRTNNVISKHSTVMYQAYINGVNVVVDDVTSPDMYRAFKEASYIMLNKSHALLSGLL